MARQFVRVRLAKIEGVDLNLFQFDRDLTLMIFFLGANEQVYGRYGSRDEKDAEGQMSLAGLAHAMKAALTTHAREKGLAPEKRGEPRFIRQYASSRRFRGCIHCHQAKEIINEELTRDGKWRREMVWRYPLPDNLGLVLDVDRGNLVKEVVPGSVAQKAGLRAGDELLKLDRQPVHSLADIGHILDHLPAEGSVAAEWKRGTETSGGSIELSGGWRRSDISWRPSARDHTPYLPLHGSDLSVSEKRDLGLSQNQLAFRQRDPAPDRVIAAGIQPGDIILGLKQKKLKGTTAREFRLHIRENYLVGDNVTIELLRDGKSRSVPMKLTR